MGISVYFVIICINEPEAGKLRERMRPAHLAYLKKYTVLMRLGDPLESGEVGIVGTFFIVNVEDRGAALIFTQKEPFHKAGVFESVLVSRGRQMHPEATPGAKMPTAREARLQRRGKA